VLHCDVVSQKKSPFIDHPELKSGNITILKAIDDPGVEKKIWGMPV
jgi:hypothetical protein